MLTNVLEAELATALHEGAGEDAEGTEKGLSVFDMRQQMLPARALPIRGPKPWFRKRGQAQGVRPETEPSRMDS